MQLTTQQLATLKAWVIANNNSLFDASAVALLNAPASPTYKVWKTSLNKHDYMEQPDVDGASAATSYALGGGNGSFINRSLQEQNGWLDLWNSVLACKPYLPFTRIAIYDVFSGAGANAVKNRIHFWARGQRSATVVEKLFAVATVGGPRNTASDGNNPAGQIGARGEWTNPDTFGTGKDGQPIDGPIDLNTVIAADV